jgi:ribosome-binding factor A
MEKYRRASRVRELLKQEVAECIRRETSIEEVGLLTVNDVGLASDLRSATVFLGWVGTAKQRQRAAALLTERTPRLRMLVGAAVRLKYTPELRFQIDDSIEKGNRVLAILEDLEKQGPASSPKP